MEIFFIQTERNEAFIKSQNDGQINGTIHASC